jgi:hypothetical protein
MTLTPSVRSPRRFLRGLAVRARGLRRDDGMATAEYAVATVAACGFGGILYKLLSSDAVLDLLMDLIKRALGFVL